MNAPANLRHLIFLFNRDNIIVTWDRTESRKREREREGEEQKYGINDHSILNDRKAHSDKNWHFWKPSFAKNYNGQKMLIEFVTFFENEINFPYISQWPYTLVKVNENRINYYFESARNTMVVLEWAIGRARVFEKNEIRTEGNAFSFSLRNDRLGVTRN